MSVDSPQKKPKMLTLINFLSKQLSQQPMVRLGVDVFAFLVRRNQEPTFRSRCRSILITLLLWCLSINNSFGTPWIEAGDEQARHHIQTLFDAGLLRSPTTSWPLVWSNIKADLDKIRPNDLNSSQLWSYRYLKHELRKAMKETHAEHTVHIGNDSPSITDFSADSREQMQSSIAVVKTKNKLAYKIEATYIHDPADDHHYRGDGSYLNYLAGNWVIGAGLVERWWGPGWESSLILSHSARPLPSVYLQRNLANPFEVPLLNLLGPWQVTTFMSQLESSAAVPKAKLWGMRVNIKPLNRLEIGLSRTAQWGGEGRSNDLNTFIDLLLGKDNLDDHNANNTADRSKEPGNQLAGIDWRWGHTFGSTGASLYGQFIGEDEAGGMPSRSIGMAGVEVSGLLWDVHTRVNLEAQNTTVYFYDSDKISGNTAYEHSIYQSGYRYYGRPIGASTDNDSESLTLRSQLQFRNGRNLNISVGHHRLNIDNSSTDDIPGGSIFGDLQTDTIKTQLNYVTPLNERILLELSLFNFSNKVEYDGTKIGTGGFVALRAQF
jgi:Capsule assembly protein Wzi